MLRVIAEAGLCANSLPWAHDAVDAAADAGCWGFKVQLLTADRITAANAPRYDRLAGPDNQHQAFEGTLPYEAWAEVYDHAREKGLEPFASCWDAQAVEVSEEMLKPDWYKVGSADITHHDLLSVIAATGKNVMLSTGAATSPEIIRALDILDKCSVLFACTLSYPAGLADARLSRIGWLRDRFGWMGGGFGYSDHVPLVDTGALAVAAGAEFLEKHFTVTPGRGGDHDFALNPQEMCDYVDRANRAWDAMYSQEGNGGPLQSELPALRLARRSLHTVSPVRRGEAIVVGVNAAWLRPATDGIPADATGPWYAERDYEAGEQV